MNSDSSLMLTLSSTGGPCLLYLSVTSLTLIEGPLSSTPNILVFADSENNCNSVLFQ